jgi:hypothetical protein
LPTVWGLALMFGVTAAVVAALAWSAYPLLAPQAPARGADGGGARTLVVEGWLDTGELRQAMAVARRGRYERVLTTGGPIEAMLDAGDHKSYALRAATLLRAAGLTELPVVAVPAPASAQDRSYLSAVMVREWAAGHGIALGAVDLYSAGVHARRSWLVYRMALGEGVEVGVLAAEPIGFDARRWWTNSIAAKMTLGEVISLAWTKCCFWPGPPGSHEERWAVPAN